MSLKSSSTGAAAATLGFLPRLAPVCLGASGAAVFEGLVSASALTLTFALLLLVSSTFAAFFSTGLLLSLALLFLATGVVALTDDFVVDFLKQALN